jgi:hypothetical protein
MVPVPTFEKVMVPVPVPVPTFEKFRFRFRYQLYIKTIKNKFFKKNFGNFFAFLHSKLFYKEKVYNFQQIFNEGNQIHSFISGSGSGTVINYGSGSDFLTSYSSGSGSTSQKVTVPTVPVPVPQHCLPCTISIMTVSSVSVH